MWRCRQFPPPRTLPAPEGEGTGEGGDHRERREEGGVRLEEERVMHRGCATVPNCLRPQQQYGERGCSGYTRLACVEDVF